MTAPTTTTASDAVVAKPDLIIEDLVVEYSSGGYAVRPIDGLNLTMRSGQLVILLGASGCGKSTLLSALASILTPTAGRIRIGDQTITGLADLTPNDHRTSKPVFLGIRERRLSHLNVERRRDH